VALAAAAAALLLPIIVQERLGRGTAAVLVVFLTLLLAQPSAGATWAMCLVVIALACDELTPDELRGSVASPAVCTTPVYGVGVFRRRADNLRRVQPPRPAGRVPKVGGPSAMGARDYISLVREQAWLILGATVIGLLAAVALAVLTPRSYAPAATFYVVSTNAGLVTASDRYSGASSRPTASSPTVSCSRAPRTAGRSRNAGSTRPRPAPAR